MKTYSVYCTFKDEYQNLSLEDLEPKDNTFEITYSSKDFLIIQSENYPMIINTEICNSKSDKKCLYDVTNTIIVNYIDNKSHYFTRDEDLKKELQKCGVSEYQFCYSSSSEL